MIAPDNFEMRFTNSYGMGYSDDYTVTYCVPVGTNYVPQFRHSNKWSNWRQEIDAMNGMIWNHDENSWFTPEMGDDDDWK